MLRLCQSLVLLLLLFSPVLQGAAPAQTPQPEADLTCPLRFRGHLPPRLTVGEVARTLAQLNIRPQPTTGLARLGVLPQGLSLDIEAGPLCNEGYVWWQITHDGLMGWVVEGSLSDEAYWLEPRGERVYISDAEGRTEAFIRDAEGNLEHEGCMPPPEDYSRVQQGYAILNARTLAMLRNAQRIYNQGGGPVNFLQSITQGSYNPGGVAASFGTHDGGGAVDISVRNFRDWSVMHTEIEPMIHALRVAGFAAWLRDTGDLYENSPIHIHAIAIGDADLSPAARQQIDGEFGYLRGYDGLPREAGIAPVADRHGGPVLCTWMREMGFDDLREETTITQADGADSGDS